MLKKGLRILTMAIAAFPAVGIAQAPQETVFVSDEDIKAVLKYAADTKRTIPDNTIRVVDMGNYQLGVAVIHRGATGAAAAAGGCNPRPRARRDAHPPAAYLVPRRSSPEARSSTVGDRRLTTR